jgi:hypothetical protein
VGEGKAACTTRLLCRTGVGWSCSAKDVRAVTLTRTSGVLVDGLGDAAVGAGVGQAHHLLQVSRQGAVPLDFHLHRLEHGAHHVVACRARAPGACQEGAVAAAGNTRQHPEGREQLPLRFEQTRTRGASRKGSGGGSKGQSTREAESRGARPHTRSARTRTGDGKDQAKPHTRPQQGDVLLQHPNDVQRLRGQAMRHINARTHTRTRGNCAQPTEHTADSAGRAALRQRSRRGKHCAQQAVDRAWHANTTPAHTPEPAAWRSWWVSQQCGRPA